jgi:hypothetical protein
MRPHGEKSERKIPAEERQLAIIFADLSLRVPDGNDLGSIIGYGIFNYLRDFNFHSRSLLQRQFEEVKALYSGFEHFLRDSRKSGEYKPHLFGLNTSTEEAIKSLGQEPPLRRVDMDPVHIDGSWIFKGILETLFYRSGNPLDRLRIYGLELNQSVKSRGTVPGNRDCLLADYSDVSQCFIREKGDRRQ